MESVGIEFFVNRYKLHPDVVWIVRPDGSSRLLHLGADICAVDPASTELLKMIVTVGFEHSVEELTARHGVSKAQVQADVQAFIRDLEKQKIIQHDGAVGSPIESFKTVAARISIPSALHLIHLWAKDSSQKAWGLLWVARWAVTRFGWATTVRLWERSYPQPVAGITPQNGEFLDLIDGVVRKTTARHILNIQCKERALACLALCRQGGVPADLVVGMTYMPLEGHVWVESGGRIISDNPEHCRPYEPVARYS